MTKFTGERLSNRGSKLWFLADDAAEAYTKLGLGSNFNGPRLTGSTGEGISFEDAGHRHPVPQDRGGEIDFVVNINHGAARTTFKMHDYVHFIKEHEDGFGEHVYVLITALDKGSLSANGLPQYKFTGLTLEDPIEIPPEDLADWLSLTLPE